MLRQLCIFLFLWFAIFASDIANAAGKLALVIGNGNYANATPLPNPANDATDVAATLQRMGFEVIPAIDATKAVMDEKLAEFAEKAETADLTLFYYAGHGMQVNLKNYLIPVDAKLEKSTALDFETLEVDDVIKYMSSSTRVGLVFLDACRDNPLSRRFKTRSRSSNVGSGLAIRAGSDKNLLIAFATAPDEVALDGNGRNSPFTTALLRHLPQPGKELRSVLTSVKSDVQEATQEQQVPWSHDNLTRELYLFGEPGTAGQPAPETGATGQPAPQPTPQDNEAGLAWEAVKDSASPAALDVVANRYPGTLYGELAKARAAELRQNAQVAVVPKPIRPAPQPDANEDDTPDPSDGASAAAAGSMTWGVIIGSFPKSQINRARARQQTARQNGLQAIIINTDQFGNLTPGLYAVIIGTRSRGRALELLPGVKSRFSDAYAKQLR